MRNASGVFDNTCPSNPAVLMRSPIRRACAVNCWVIGFELAIFYKYQAKSDFSTLESSPVALGFPVPIRTGVIRGIFLLQREAFKCQASHRVSWTLTFTFTTPM